MTDKERLKEIEAKYSTLTVSSERDGIEYTEVDVKDLVFLVQNGFKQVELVQELENEIENQEIEISNWEESYFEIEKHNQRYREALEEIKELTRFDDGSKEKEYEIACKALEGEK